MAVRTPQKLLTLKSPPNDLPKKVAIMGDQKNSKIESQSQSHVFFWNYIQ